MSNRRWLDIAEYVSFSGSVLGLIASAISQQVIFASAPLSFCILLNLVNRRRLDQQTGEKILPALDDLKQQLAKEHHALQAMQQHMMAMPRPDDLGALKRAAIQSDRQVSAQVMDRIAQLQTQLESRLAPLEAIDLQPTWNDIRQLQTRHDQLEESLVNLNQNLKSRAPSARVTELERAIADLISENHQLGIQLQDLASQPPPDLTPLQNQLQQLTQQVNTLPPPFNPKHLEDKLKILTHEMEKSIQEMTTLASKQDLSVLQSEIDQLQQRQQSLSQSLRPVRDTVETMQGHLGELKQQFRERTDPQMIEELRRGLAKVIQSVTTLESQTQNASQAEDLAELRQEVHHSTEELHEQIAAMHQVTRTLNREQGELQQSVTDIQQTTAHLTEEHQSLSEQLSQVTAQLTQEQQALLEQLNQARAAEPTPELLPIQVEVLATRLEALEGRVEDLQMYGPYGHPHDNGNGAGHRQEREEGEVSLEEFSLAIQAGDAQSAPVADDETLLLSDAVPELPAPDTTPVPQAANRALLEDALTIVHDSLIVTRAWLDSCELDQALIEQFQAALERTIQIQVMWGPPADGEAHPARRIRQNESTEQSGESELLVALQPLQQYGPHFQLKGVGTQEQLLICDRAAASLVRRPLSDSPIDHEVGLQTSDPEIIHHLLHNLDDISLDPDSSAAYFLRAAARYELGDLHGALSDYSQGLKLAPGDDVAYNNRGLIYYQLGGRERALADFDQALSCNPSNSAAYYNRGVARADLGDRDGAIADYTQALRLAPDDDTLYNNRGLVYSKLGNYIQAQKDYTEAIHLNPSNAIAYNNRGLVRSRLGDKKGAVDDYTRALELRPEDDSVYFNRGAVRASLEDYQGAIADYSEAIRLNPEFVNAYNNRGFVHQKLGDKQAAIADFDRALDINPKFANAYNNRGTTRSKLKDFQGAIHDFDQALQINPNFANAYNNRGTARSKLKDFQGAVKDFNRALQINPNFANAYNNRGLARSDLGDRTGAIADLQQAAHLFQAQGDSTSSQQALMTLSRLQPEPVPELPG